MLRPLFYVPDDTHCEMICVRKTTGRNMTKKALSLLISLMISISLLSPFALAAEREWFCAAPLSTVPESAAADPAWFSDACLIGHSQAEGMREHMELPQMDYYALNGLKASQALKIGVIPLPSFRIARR